MPVKLNNIHSQDAMAMQRLVNDLQTQPQSALRDKIIDSAKKLHYSDFSNTYDCPKMQLIDDLKLAGLTELVKKVMNGDYDA